MIAVMPRWVPIGSSATASFLPICLPNVRGWMSGGPAHFIFLLGCSDKGLSSELKPLLHSVGDSDMHIAILTISLIAILITLFYIISVLIWSGFDYVTVVVLFAYLICLGVAILLMLKPYPRYALGCFAALGASAGLTAIFGELVGEFMLAHFLPAGLLCVTTMLVLWSTRNGQWTE
jgi:hypothetical protein